MSIGMQCRLLSFSQSSFYYESQGESEMNLAQMPPLDGPSVDADAKAGLEDFALRSNEA
jgi:hypothetical protein